MLRVVSRLLLVLLVLVGGVSGAVAANTSTVNGVTIANGLPQAARGVDRARHVLPAPGMTCFRMYVETLAVRDGERQRLEELALRRTEHAAGPFHCGLRRSVHLLARVADRMVVIAEHGHRAPIDQYHHRPRRPLRIGAVADIVSQQHEAGDMPGFEAVLHYGIVAPAGTPTAIVNKLNIALRAAVMSDELKAKLAADGTEPLASTPEEYAADIDKEETKWSAIVRKSGAKAE